MLINILKNTFLVASVSVLIIILAVYALILYIFISASHAGGFDLPSLAARIKAWFVFHGREIAIFVLILILLAFIIGQILVSNT